MRRVIRWGAQALVLASVTACAPSYDTLDVGWVRGSSDGEASSRGFVVPEGKVLVFEADPKSGRGRDFEATDALVLSSEDPAVARVEQGLAVGTWMIMGVAEGSTSLEVWINGAFEERRPIDVTAQEEVSP